jgi:hypothetical protein
MKSARGGQTAACLSITQGVSQAMKLYGFGPTRSLRALWALKELGPAAPQRIAQAFKAIRAA